WQQYNSFPFTF
nr:immunoglobulin light chain junction region [Macaca mulatta]